MIQLVLAFLVTLALLAFIVYSVFTNNKSIGSFIQLGEIQRRQEVYESVIKEFKDDVQKKAVKLSSQVSLEPLRSTSVSERFAFTVGVCNAILTSYLLGHYPTQFYLWYSPKMVVLVFLRWRDFVKKNSHYLLADFCYWANALTFVYCWFFPRSKTLFLIVFCAANGPLAWSILAFNQAIVFHKWQQTVSVHIHIAPMLLTYGLRWYESDRFVVCDDFPTCADVNPLHMLLEAETKFYLLWIVGYYVFIFLFLGPYLQSRSFTTLYDRVASKQLKFLASLPFHDLLKKAVYMLTHLVFGTFTMLLACYIWFWYWWAHFLFISTLFVMSAYNASRFYDQSFSTTADQKKN